jgi:spore coat polysaccharide biosynthesis protein SpsF
MDSESKYTTEQEAFWAGQFGDEYIDRNAAEQLLIANVALFSQILRRADPISSLIEFGANIGMNLHAMKRLLPDCQLDGVEINPKAAEILRETGFVNVFEESILQFAPPKQYDMSFIKCVLIHINPEHLEAVYERLYQASRQYICVIEYYNPTPVALSYRGHQERLFKRDFAGEILDRYSDLRLVDYGFIYRRDRFPQDDLTWFLLEK